MELIDARIADAFRDGREAERRELREATARYYVELRERMHQNNANHYAELLENALGRLSTAQEWLDGDNRRAVIRAGGQP